MPLTSRTASAHIVAERVSFARPDGRALFHDLTLAFGNERTGVIGPNGVGKSTLAELLLGSLTPQSGVVRRRGRVAYLEQGFTAAPATPLVHVLGVEARLAALARARTGEATIEELALVGDAWDLDARLSSTLARFGLAHLSLERPVGSLSGGEGARLALARVVFDEPDFIILDEPSNHLDVDGRSSLARFVAEWTRGLLCISHDRALLRGMDRIVALSTRGVELFGGGYDAYAKARAAEVAAAEREWQSARAELSRAEREAREQRERQARRDAQGRRSRLTANMPKLFLNDQRARAQATGARVRRVTEREVAERLERVSMARSELDTRVAPRFSIDGAHVHPSLLLLRLTDVAVRLPHSRRPQLVGLDLQIAGPERVALTGPNGSGKTTLLRIAAGLLAPDAGEVHRAVPAATRYLDQRALSLESSRSVLENFHYLNPSTAPADARRVLARYEFPGDAALQLVHTLSGGARLRAALACALGSVEPPALLLLDEPTNHLDLDAIASLEVALREYEGAFIVVSHDADFLEAIGVERTVALGVQR